MKKISEFVSPGTLASLHCSIGIPLFILFQPGWKDLCLFFLVDFALCGLGILFIKKTFSVFYPDSQLFFPEFKEGLQTLNDDGKRLVYNAMLEYPWRMAITTFFINCVKSTPSACFVIFYWDHSLSLQLACVFCLVIILFNNSYMSAMVYLENHAFLSQTIAKLHKDSDWSVVFLKTKIDATDLKRTGLIEKLIPILLWACLGALNVALVFDQTSTPMVKCFESIGMTFFACLFSTRIHSYSRKEMLQGIDSLIDFHSAGGDFKRIIPIHTLPLVRYYQKAFNQLVQKLQSTETEIASWIRERSEKKRYADLGEMAALVVHDLVNPMHNMHYSIDVIEQKKDSALDPYTTQLRENLNEVIQLLHALKDNIRNPNGRFNLSSIPHAASSMVKTLKYHFTPGAVQNVKFVFDFPENMIDVVIPQPELNQILINLVTNSVRNLLGNEISSPEVRVHFEGTDGIHAFVRVSDNGTGLSLMDFEFLTESHDALSKKDGVGLRLTRRLVEHYGGSLTLSEGHGLGTVFTLGLRMSPQREAVS